MTVLISIRNVPGSNLGWDIDYPDGGFSGFLQCLQANSGIYPKLDHDRILPYPSSFTTYFTIRCHVI
jgi:hypothetical protein